MYHYVFGKNGSLSSGAPPKSGDFHQTWGSGLEPVEEANLFLIVAKK